MNNYDYPERDPNPPEPKILEEDKKYCDECGIEYHDCECDFYDIDGIYYCYNCLAKLTVAEWVDWMGGKKC